MKHPLRHRGWLLAGLLVATVGHAQNASDQGAPAPPAPIVLTPAPPVVLGTDPVPAAPLPTPSPRATPPSPGPSAAATPRPAATARSAVTAPVDRPRRSPRIAEPRASLPPSVMMPAPAPIPTIALPDESGRPPQPAPGVATRERQPGSEGGGAIAWLIGLAAAALIGAALWFWRWSVARRRQAALVNTRVPTGPMPPPKPREPDQAARFWTPAAPSRAAPAEPATAAPEPRAHVSAVLSVRRAGINLFSATAEVEVALANTGEGAAAGVSVGLHLLGASAEQDRALGELFAAPPPRPAAPPFALAPGETRTIRATLALSRAAIVPLSAGDRPMFVPVVAVDVRYELPGGGQGQTAAAYLIGATRPDSDKLAPFWLDAPPRTLDEVAARPHALSIAS